MDLYELCGGDEDHPVYQEMATANGRRHYDFLNSVIEAATAFNLRLDASIIKAINYHAIAGLHSDAGQYRSYAVEAGDYVAPDFRFAEQLMDDFVATADADWDKYSPLALATFALWRINHIHPFRNGNGRTARAVCYFIICVKLGGPLPGNPILPELFREDQEHTKYVAALKEADLGDLGPLAKLVQDLASRQISSIGPPSQLTPKIV